MLTNPQQLIHYLMGTHSWVSQEYQEQGKGYPFTTAFQCHVTCSRITRKESKMLLSLGSSAGPKVELPTY